MIGNDVVDLTAPLADRHPRFDARVFARSERRALEASGAGERLRCMFWACKEAAYKAARKADPAVVFSPSRFVVELGPDLRGEVVHGGDRFAVRVEEAPDFVHAVVWSPDVACDEIFGEVARRPDAVDERRAVRDLARRAVAERAGARRSEVEIVREGRIPFVRIRGRRSALDLSLSHDGPFVAFVCRPGTEAPFPKAAAS